jgi:hypothetical protein
LITTPLPTRSRSRRSISKHRGAAMSSRLIPPKAGARQRTTIDDGVDVLRGQADRPPVAAGEPLEQRGLAFHDRQRGDRPDVAQAQDRGAVGHDRDGVALDREVARVARIMEQAPGDRSDARRVDAGQVLPVPDRRPHVDLDPPAGALRRPLVVRARDRRPARRPRGAVGQARSPSAPRLRRPKRTSRSGGLARGRMCCADSGPDDRPG